MALSLLVSDTNVKDCKIITMSRFEDHRGFFREAFNITAFRQCNLPTEYPQDNISWSYKGVLRGLHMQMNNPQGKLVSCPEGEIFDVCVDVREDSPTFGLYTCAVIGPDKAIYCPPGTLHGFLALKDSMVYYKCTSLYDKDTDGGVYALDQELKIPWPNVGEQAYVMSEKDMHLATLAEYLKRYKEWKTRTSD